MAPKRLKVLAISDTHLGEETSLLSFPRGLQHLWHIFAENQDFWKPIFGADFDPRRDRIEVEDLVLLGDVVDRSLSSTSQISAHAHAFAMMINSAVHVERAIYVPGNHDHTLWTGFAEASSEFEAPGITCPEGETVVRGGKLLDAAAEEMVSIFLGYPIGWAWWEIERGSRQDFEFAVANPLYAKEIKGRTHVFAHGTHFRPELVSRWQRGLVRLGDVLNLDKLFADIEFEPLRMGLSEAESMEELEQIVAPFADSLWPSSKNAPTSRSDELWYLMTLLREGPDPGRNTPEKSEIFPRNMLKNDPQRATIGRIDKLTRQDGEPLDESLKRFRKYFLPCLRDHLANGELLSNDAISFIYGDTHRGGYGNLATIGEDKSFIRIYNTGGWVVPAGGGHPACHLYAVDEKGEEYLLDLAFGEDVKVDKDTTLLRLAANDVEHRLEAVESSVRNIGEGLRFLKELW